MEAYLDKSETYKEEVNPICRERWYFWQMNLGSQVISSRYSGLLKKALKQDMTKDYA